MFTFDRSQSCIEVAEPDVVAVYRSTVNMAASLNGISIQNGEVIVCAVMEEENAMVYLALLESSSKQVFIFSPEKKSQSGKSSDDVILEALRVAESIGFVMESVNLNYGRALREVVLRGIRAFRITSAKGSKQSIPLPGKREFGEALEKRKDVKAKSLPFGKENGSASILPGHLSPPEVTTAHCETARDAHQNAAPDDAACARVGARNNEGEVNAAKQPGLEKRAGEQMEEDHAEREQRQKEKSDVGKRAAELAEKGRLDLIETEAEGERLYKEKIATELYLAQQTEALLVAQKQAEEERADLDRVHAEQVAAERHAFEQAEAVRGDLETAESAHLERENLLKEKEATEKLATERLEREHCCREEAEAERAERERVHAEKVAAERHAFAQCEASRGAWERVESELNDAKRLLEEIAGTVVVAESRADEARQALEKAETARVKLEKVLAEKASEEKLAAERLETVRLEWEKAEAERVGCESFLAEKAGIENFALQTAESTLLVLGKVRSDKVELEKLFDEKCKAEMLAGKLAEADRSSWENCKKELQLFVQEVSCLSPEPSPMQVDEKCSMRSEGMEMVPEFEESSLLEQVPCPQTESVAHAKVGEELNHHSDTEVHDNDPFAFIADIKSSSSYEAPLQDRSGYNFVINPSLRHVSFSAVREVKKLLSSLNMARVTIEGVPSQNSSAFLCVLEKAGAPQVFFALYLAEDRKTLVYEPQKQPETLLECEATVHEGMFFAETVGFMMDSVDLGSDEERAIQLAAIPVFRRQS